MRLSRRRPWRLLLFGLGLLLVVYALLGLVRSFPDFNAVRREPAAITLSPPAVPTTP